MPNETRSKALEIGLRVGVFAAVGIIGLVLFGWLMLPVAGYLVTSALSVFGAAAIANFLLMRLFEHRVFSDAGLSWNADAARNLLLGVAGGVGSAGIILAGAIASGAAELRTVPGSQANWGGLVFIALVLLFGAAGEELLFRGYAFQVLMRVWGPFATILPLSILFAAAHSTNLNVSFLGLVNTFGWGVLLGCAFWRSGDLYLPIGLHFGWNLTLPLFGVGLSGFRMDVTGYVMHWVVHPLWSGGAYGPEAGILTTAILFPLFFYLWKAPIRRQSPYLLRGTLEA